jgi:hypothetical protein
MPIGYSAGEVRQHVDAAIGGNGPIDCSGLREGKIAQDILGACGVAKQAKGFPVGADRMFHKTEQPIDD